MKLKKSISIEKWLYDEILRTHPTARRNFSKVINHLLSVSVNNPIAYYRNRAKYHMQEFQMAKQHLETLEGLKKEHEEKKRVYGQ